MKGDSDIALHPDQVDELPEYRTISALAVVGLILSLFSPLALGRGLLIIVPVVAGAVCAIALIRIGRSEGRLAGRKAAVIGLCLAFFFAAAVPAQYLTLQKALHARAEPVARAWLQALQQRQPHVAHQLTKPDLTRRTLSGNLWGYYRGDQTARRELEAFVEEEAVRFLLTLGGETEIHFYEPGQITPLSSTTRLVTQRYAVTYEDPNAGRTTFFIAVSVERRDPTDRLGEQWRVADYSADVRPS
jgi:hypothetical protein